MNIRASFFPLILSSILPCAVVADSSVIEEIVVRGEFRDTSLLDTPASISVLRPDSRKDVVDHLEEMLTRTANVNLASGASRARYLQVRGIGETGQFAEPLNASVGLILDGVDLSGVGGAATTYDLEQIEVFRGPQGTLYGANALAGLLNLTSASPVDEWYGRVDVDAASYDSIGVGGVVSGPVTDQLSMRIAARRHEDDGFLKNDFLDRDDTNRRRETTVRAKLAWQSEAAQWLLTYGHVDTDNLYDAFSLDNNRHTLSDQPGEDRQRTDYASLVAGFDLANGSQLEFTLGHADSKIAYGYDEDWTFEGFHPFGYSSTDHYARDWQTTSLDIRLISSPTPTEGEWVTGVYALKQDVELSRSYTFLDAPYESRQEVQRLAVYGEWVQPFAEQFRLTVGLRVERNSADFNDSEAIDFSPAETMIGGRVVVEYDLDPAMLYLSLTRGYKTGGFNTSGTLDEDLRQFDSELLWNVEAGVKGDIAEQLQVRAAVFWMERRDVQVGTSITRVRSDGSAEFIDYTGNAAEGFNRGLELEFAWQPHAQWNIEGSLGWLDTQYDNFINGSGEQLDGREQAQAPGYQFYLGVEFTPVEHWFIRLDAEGRDQYFFSDSHGVQSPAYELLHLSAGYESERWRASIWARNVTDEDPFVRGFFFGNDPRDDYTPRGFTQLGEPRRVGVSLAVIW